MKRARLTSGILAYVLLAMLASCGGPAATEASEPDHAVEPEMDEAEAGALQRLRQRQAVVCEDFCVRMNDCVREDAMTNNPEVLATKDGISGEQLLEKHKADCVDQCNNSGVMTPEQRRTMVDTCLPIEACGEFASCSTRALSK